MITSHLDAFIIVICKCLCLVYYMNDPIHATNPYTYSILILLFTTIITTAIFTVFLLLLYYCYCYKTVATDKPLRASLLSGAAELTTHLSRLIIILCLPLVSNQ